MNLFGLAQIWLHPFRTSTRIYPILQLAMKKVSSNSLVLHFQISSTFMLHPPCTEANKWKIILDFVQLSTSIVFLNNSSESWLIAHIKFFLFINPKTPIHYQYLCLLDNIRQNLALEEICTTKSWSVIWKLKWI